MSAKDNIKTIWEYFKAEKDEHLMLFSFDGGEILAETISKNENDYCGEVDLSKLEKIAERFRGKQTTAVHNHPKDRPNPSNPDYFMCEFLRSALNLLQVRLRDFVIVSEYGYVSFAENGAMPVDAEPRAEPAFESERVSFPAFCFSDDVIQNQNEIIPLLSRWNEIIATNKEAFASPRFSGEELLRLSERIGGKCLFFCAAADGNMDAGRLKDIDAVLEPFEIYALKSGSLLSPWKINLKI